MNAENLFEQIEAVSDAPSGAEGRGIIDGCMLAGIEFIHAEPMSEKSFRASWKRRKGTGPTPLLMFSDDQADHSRVVLVGPSSADEPIRFVRAEALSHLITKLSGMSGLKAIRLLASELAEIDASGTPGLVVHGIGTEHLFKDRLPAGGDWQKLVSSVEGLESLEWRDLLIHLGYSLEKLPKRGYAASYEGKRILVIHPTKDVESFSRLDENGALREGALLAACQAENVEFGLLAAGARMRLFLAGDVGGAATRYLELDIGLLEESDRGLLGLLSPAFILDQGFDRIIRDARDYGATLRSRLDRILRQEVLPVLARELGKQSSAAGIDLTIDAERERIEGACLTFVFRALFLLYAESTGSLPMAHEAYRSRSLTNICQRAHSEEPNEAEDATTLWDDLTSVIHAMRSGKADWGVPAYNGELFAANGLIGAELLEKFAIPDREIAKAFSALGRDHEGDEIIGLDYSGLEIGHLGHLYEGLLSLRLGVAERDLTYVERRDRYMPTPESETPDVAEGELTWLTHEGGRKGGGVYYTPARLVRHLVLRSVRPAFEEHLTAVRELLESDPEGAARELFEFHVVDPACGSAHFLVQVADELADQVAKLLGNSPIPAIQKELEAMRSAAGKTYDLGIEDAALLKRLVLKQCVFGVDISQMGTEIAKLSLWLAGFVPGLSLAYLDRNIVWGNSLVGIIDPEEVAVSDRADGSLNIFGGTLSERLKAASVTANELQQIPDLTPDEINQSRAKNDEYIAEVAGANRLMDIWTAGSLGFGSARKRALDNGEAILSGDLSLDDEEAVKAARKQSALHWPTAFAETFSRPNPGFDVVVGNPPWDEVTVEELGFFARYKPGLRGLPAIARAQALAGLKLERPELEAEFSEEQERMANLRTYLAREAPEAISAGDPDLYKYFSNRYQSLLRAGGRLGVVLPRSAFLAKGMANFRRWLEEKAPIERVDFALNNRNWIFDIHPQYTVALVAARKGAEASAPEVAGVATSAAAFEEQSEQTGTILPIERLGPALEIPLAPSKSAYDMVARMGGTPFALGGGAWKCFPVGELHETNDRAFWLGAEDGWELWKGASFDQYEPAGHEARPCPPTDELLAKVKKVRGNPGSGSLASEGVPTEVRRAAVERTFGRARVAFRDVTNRTNSRTVIGCLVPPRTFLTNKAPYLVFLEDDLLKEAACLAILNSVPFDWQARRYVELNMNFFILELLKVPALSDDLVAELGKRGARLSCIDDRFAEFAQACGVECGPLSPKSCLDMKTEIDAIVAGAWGLSVADVKLMLEDFPESEAGLTTEYREHILKAMEQVANVPT